LAVAAMAAGDLTAQTPGTPSRNRRVWTGTIDDREILLGEHDTTPIRRPVQYFQNVQVSFTFVSEDVPDRPGFTRWVSRQLSWTAYGYSASSIQSYECTHSGSLELGPADGYDHTTPDQDERLHVPCTHKTAPTVWAFIKRPNLEVRLPEIDLSMTNCEPPRRWSEGGVRYTLAVAGADRALTAVVNVDQAAYPAFVPKPGEEKLTLTAVSSSGPVRFRFVLDPSGTSRFPGYATNANVDDAFLEAHGLTDLPGGYGNDSPDLIFHPRNFNRDEWSTVGLDTVETRNPQTSASVTVTELDYGAVGHLRAYAQAGECAGGWQPIVFRVGGHSKDTLAIPPDEDDNVIADALEEYRGLDSGADADAEPKGNGMAGDGLTAFEEYRGLLTSGGDCADPGTERHVRTKPGRKDLFVHASPQRYEAGLRPFAESSRLDVHAICERHYSRSPRFDSSLRSADGDLGTRTSDRARIVNFTLQFARLHTWQGREISQQVPQHALYLASGCVPGMRGVACTDPPACLADNLGPPMLTAALFVCPYDDDPSYIPLGIIVHELGHAVGMPHHGAKAEGWRMVQVREHIVPDRNGSPIPGQGPPRRIGIEPGPDCQDPRSGGAPPFSLFYKNEFVGCATHFIVRQNGDMSGNAECPMRYAGGTWFYEASEEVARKGPIVLFDEGWEGDQRHRIPNPARLQLYSGRFGVYDESLDPTGIHPFCTLKTGTGLNAADRGHGNHAGDSQVACMDQLVINDNVLRGVR
jgi:hypothetical protein